MSSAEVSRSENVEVEMTPEQVASDAVSVVENKEASDPIASSKSTEGFKNFLKSSGGVAIDAGRAGGAVIVNMGLGILKFAKEMIIKKGKVGFGRAYEMGQDMFSFEAKKEKK